ncbi:MULTISPECIES: helix-turn-helix domain-containing protein [Planococcus]|uniref:MarR family transcriptional regulator n=1 Tax=Planococcus faecalis TaxID=1598147 RepID=A0ABM6IWC9_9BACL|nr:MULTISPECIES: helix-turn-helix domain-containing protein [Planococcus]AQU80893.1 MarR family transcriptional regulator [Planococcus faecalis]MDJ0332185.1 helix-turn-helix domain-containing protein [Planococcus sp. S3-L1]OHX55862.1 MarR family transcriptional regulator [Planococcus faecalis]
MGVKNSYICSLGLTIDLIGGKWKLMILWYLINGSKRFGELKKSIPTISQKVLTEQLKELESSRIISRKVYPTVPATVEYSMTDYGESLIPLIHDLCDWTKQYAGENDIEISGD